MFSRHLSQPFVLNLRPNSNSKAACVSVTCIHTKTKVSTLKQWCVIPHALHNPAEALHEALDGELIGNKNPGHLSASWFLSTVSALVSHLVSLYRQQLNSNSVSTGRTPVFIHGSSWLALFWLMSYWPWPEPLWKLHKNFNSRRCGSPKGHQFNNLSQPAF